MSPPYSIPLLHDSALTTTPRTNSTRSYEPFSIGQSTLEDFRLDLIEDGADMSYCLSTSDFLKKFFPIPKDDEAPPKDATLPKGAKLPKGARPCKPKGINFNDVKGYTLERDLAERWVSGSVVMWYSLPLHAHR